jgi:hypothetical protein
MATKTTGKTKGRTSITSSRKADPTGGMKSRRFTENEKKTQKNRSMESGRGDRRDMSKTYTGTAKHAARGNTPRKDVKTRAR